MLNEVLDELEASYKATVIGLRKELAKIRTGRANVSLLDSVRIEYYGSPTPLNQVASLKVADPRLISVQPWEKTLIADIEKAIMSAGLGLNPSNDGTVIRVPIPALTGERRQELVKRARKVGEEHKISLRNARREANDMVKDLQKESEITEDDMHKGFEQVNALTEKYSKSIESVLDAKEEEIIAV